MSTHPDHELEELEDDSSVPPRPEEEVADSARYDRADAPSPGWEQDLTDETPD